MAIKDLVPKQGKVDVTVTLVSKGDVREFQKFGKAGRVCNAKVKDATGEIELTLWNDDIDKVNPGDTLHITNGYVSEWQGEKQLSTGRYGKMEVVSSGNAPAPENAPASEDMKTDAGEHVLTDDESTEEEVLDGLKSDDGEHILTDDEKKEEEVFEEEVPNGEEKKE